VNEHNLPKIIGYKRKTVKFGRTSSRITDITAPL
jgi:hypothetical protein